VILRGEGKSQMTSVGEWVRKVFELTRAGSSKTVMLQQNQAIASLLEKMRGATSITNLRSLMERMTGVLQRISGLQVTTYGQEVASIQLPREIPPEPGLGALALPSPEPTRVTISRGSSPLTEIIRNIVRRFRGQQPRRTAEKQPQEPTPPRRREEREIPEPEPQRPRPTHEVTEPTRPRRARPPQPGEPRPRRPKTTFSIPEYTRRVAATMPFVLIPSIGRLLGREPAPEIRPPAGVVETFEPMFELGHGPRVSSMMEAPMRIALEMAGKGPQPPGGIPRIHSVTQMGHDVAKWVAGTRGARPSAMEAGTFENLLGVRNQIVDTVTQRVVEARETKASFDWKSSILKAVGVVGKEVFPRTRRPRSAPWVPVPRVSRLSGAAGEIPGMSEAPEQIASLISPVLKREGESKAALVISEVSRVTKFLAEKGAEVYRQVVEKAAPEPVRIIAKGLKRLPDLTSLPAKDLFSATETLETIQLISEEVGGREEAPTKHPLIETLKKARDVGEAFKKSVQGVMEKGVEEIPGVAKELLGQQLTPGPSKEMVKPASKVSEVTKVVEDTVSVMAKLVESKGEAEETLKSSIHEVVNKMKELPMEGKTLESTLLEQPTPPIAPKEMAETLSMASAASSAGKVISSAVSMVSKLMKSKGVSEKRIQETVSLLTSKMQEVPAKELTLDRVPLEGPRPVPSPKLQEVMPVLSQMTPVTEAAKGAPPARRERALQRQRPIEVKVESRIDDIDMKELERKIARILKEEARRYGVY
jgi:hypothetical protein